MTNIAEILKDYPKGTKLYSPLCGECELSEEVNELEVYPITVYCKDSEGRLYLTFTKDGRYSAFTKNGECLLFPSKDNRDWESMRKKPTFKPGDIVVTGCDGIAILSRPKEDDYIFQNHWWYVAHLNIYGTLTTDETHGLPVRLANMEEICRLSRKLVEKHLVYNSEKNIIEPEKKEHVFQPFEQVLVRDRDTAPWRPDIFSRMEDSQVYRYGCLRTVCRQCIPYKGNEHLNGTTDKPTE